MIVRILGLLLSFVLVLTYGATSLGTTVYGWDPQYDSSAFRGQKPQPAPKKETLDQQMENDRFPIHPEEKMTQGSLCNTGNTLRYPEKIRYCERSVDTSRKNQIIKDYDQAFGYKIQAANRQDFKIDHLIPLCMGGSNETNNLWPQHKSVYAITDPLEPEMCNKMAEGKLKQKDAMQMILFAKNNLDQVPAILKKIRAL